MQGKMLHPPGITSGNAPLRDAMKPTYPVRSSRARRSPLAVVAFIKGNAQKSSYQVAFPSLDPARTSVDSLQTPMPPLVGFDDGDQQSFMQPAEYSSATMAARKRLMERLQASKQVLSGTTEAGRDQAQPAAVESITLNKSTPDLQQAPLEAASSLPLSPVEASTLTLGAAPEDLSAALSLLQEAGAAQEVLSLARLQLEPYTAFLPPFVVKDASVAVARAFLDLAAQARTRGSIYEAFDALQAAARVLRKHGAGGRLLEEVEESLTGITLPYTLSALSRATPTSASPAANAHRQRAMSALEAVLWLQPSPGRRTELLTPLKAFLSAADLILLYDKRCREQLTRHQQHASASSAMIVPQVPLSDAVASASSSMTPDADTDLSLGNNSVASVAAGLGATDCSDQEVYDLAIAHIAEGYTSCWPHHITVADELFTLVEALNHEVDVSQEKLVCSIMLGLEKPLPQRSTGSNSTASSTSFGFLPASLGQLITSAAGIRNPNRRAMYNLSSSNSDGAVLLDPASVSEVGSIRTALGSQDEWSELDQAAAAALAAATASTWVSQPGSMLAGSKSQSSSNTPEPVGANTSPPNQMWVDTWLSMSVMPNFPEKEGLVVSLEDHWFPAPTVRLYNQALLVARYRGIQTAWDGLQDASTSTLNRLQQLWQESQAAIRTTSPGQLANSFLALPGAAMNQAVAAGNAARRAAGRTLRLSPFGRRKVIAPSFVGTSPWQSQYKSKGAVKSGLDPWAHVRLGSALQPAVKALVEKQLHVALSSSDSISDIELEQPPVVVLGSDAPLAGAAATVTSNTNKSADPAVGRDGLSPLPPTDTTLTPAVGDVTLSAPTLSTVPVADRQEAPVSVLSQPSLSKPPSLQMRDKRSQVPDAPTFIPLSGPPSVSALSLPASSQDAATAADDANTVISAEGPMESQTEPDKPSSSQDSAALWVVDSTSGRIHPQMRARIVGTSKSNSATLRATTSSDAHKGLFALQLELIALRLTSLGGRVAMTVGMGVAVAAMVMHNAGRGSSQPEAHWQAQDSPPPPVAETVVTQNTKGQVLQILQEAQTATAPQSTPQLSVPSDKAAAVAVSASDAQAVAADPAAISLTPQGADKLLRGWFAVRAAAFGVSHQTPLLDKILGGSLLQQQSKDAERLAQQRRYLHYTSEGVAVIAVLPANQIILESSGLSHAQISQICPLSSGDPSLSNKAVVVVADCVEKGAVLQAKRKFAGLVDRTGTAQDAQDSFDVKHRLAYRMEWQEEGGWRIVSVTTLQ